MSWFHSQLQLRLVDQLRKLRQVGESFWQADFWQQFEQERLS